MSDRRLRSLERRWLETGAPEDEAALLRARLRAGGLPSERLELARILGHLPAALALGDAAPPFQTLLAFSEALQPWGEEVCVRAGLASARCLLPYWEESAHGDSRLADALAGAEAWLDCPCRAHRLAAEEVASRLLPKGSGEQVREAAAEGARAVTRSAALPASVPADDPRGLRSRYALAALVEAGDVAPPRTVHAAVRAALVPWLLGYGDALRAQVRARREAAAQLAERFARSGRTEDEERLLRARLGAGSLSRMDARLAAYLGHRGASAALGPDAPTPPADLGEWIVGLSDWSYWAPIQGFLLVARLLSERDDPAGCFAAVEEWGSCPCPGHAQLAHDAATRAAALGARSAFLCAEAAFVAHSRANPGRSRALRALFGRLRALALAAGHEEETLRGRLRAALLPGLLEREG